MSEWVSVEDGLPRIGKYVLCHSGGNNNLPYTACRYAKKIFKDFTSDISFPKYWQPLPAEPPQEDKE